MHLVYDVYRTKTADLGQIELTCTGLQFQWFSCECSCILHFFLSAMQKMHQPWHTCYMNNNFFILVGYYIDNVTKCYLHNCSPNSDELSHTEGVWLHTHQQGVVCTLRGKQGNTVLTPRVCCSSCYSVVIFIFLLTVWTGFLFWVWIDSSKVDNILSFHLSGSSAFGGSAQTFCTFCVVYRFFLWCCFHSNHTWTLLKKCFIICLYLYCCPSLVFFLVQINN